MDSRHRFYLHKILQQYKMYQRYGITDQFIKMCNMWSLLKTNESQELLPNHIWAELGLLMPDSSVVRENLINFNLFISPKESVRDLFWQFISWYHLALFSACRVHKCIAIWENVLLDYANQTVCSWDLIDSKRGNAWYDLLMLSHVISKISVVDAIRGSHVSWYSICWYTDYILKITVRDFFTLPSLHNF